MEQYDGDITRVKDKDTFVSIKQGTDDWKTLRSMCLITASEMGAIVGVDKNCSRPQIWKRKVTPGGWVPTSYQQGILDWGITHEPICYNILQTELPKVRRYKSVPVKLVHTGTWILRRNKGDKYVYGCTPDALLMQNVNDAIRVEAVVEIKCPSNLDKANTIELDLVTGKVRIPLSHFVQVQMQMRAVGVTLAYYAVYFPSKLVVISMKSNTAFQEWVMDKMEDFADKYMAGSLPTIKGDIKWLSSPMNVCPPDFKRGEKKNVETLIEKFMAESDLQLVSKLDLTSHSPANLAL